MKRKSTMFYSKTGLKLLLLLPIALFFLDSCNPNEGINTSKQDSYTNQVVGNKFYEDPVLKEIYTLKNYGKTQELLTYLNNDNYSYLLASISSLAMLQDTLAVMPLITLLNHENESVREQTAYALGMIGSPIAEGFLISAYEKEESLKVKRQLLEALGRCGLDEGLIFVASQNFLYDEKLLLLGQAWGLTRFSIRKRTNELSTQKVIEIVTNDNITSDIKLSASNYFLYLSNSDLSKYLSELITQFNNSAGINYRSNVLVAISRIRSMEAYEVIREILTEDEYDYRIKVRAITSSYAYSYENIKGIMFHLAKDKDLNVAIAACNFILNKGEAKDADEYFLMARQLTDWQTRTIMLKASLRYAEDKEKITESIISGYENAENVFEKAELLNALAGNPLQYNYVRRQIKQSNNKIVSTSAIKTLVEMRANPNFDLYHRKVKQETGDDLYQEFGVIFEEAVGSDDPAQVYYGAKAIANKDFGFKEIYTIDNIFFLTQALNSCTDYRVYNQLKKTIEYMYEDKEIDPIKIKFNKVDWNIVASIPENQKVKIITNKGNIILQLNVNQAPIAVANFVKLINENYYANTYFYRVSSDFTIENGSKRGDGWGPGSLAIQTEISQDYFNVGAVGMKRSVDEPENTQWFIAKAPQADFNDKYTNFAQVVAGMDVVHSIEVGDVIKTMELMN